MKTSTAISQTTVNKHLTSPGAMSPSHLYVCTWRCEADGVAQADCGTSTVSDGLQSPYIYISSIPCLIDPFCLSRTNIRRSLPKSGTCSKSMYQMGKMKKNKQTMSALYCFCCRFMEHSSNSPCVCVCLCVAMRQCLPSSQPQKD